MKYQKDDRKLKVYRLVLAPLQTRPCVPRLQSFPKQDSWDVDDSGKPFPEDTGGLLVGASLACRYNALTSMFLTYAWFDRHIVHLHLH